MGPYPRNHDTSLRGSFLQSDVACAIAIGSELQLTYAPKPNHQFRSNGLRLH